jgi:hypothetical protein
MSSSEALSRASRTVLLVLFSLTIAAIALRDLARLAHDEPAWVDLAPAGASAPPAPSGLVIVFVDSLRDEIARDAAVMPRLAALGEKGARFSVTPCRDQLTYLCLRAAFTGRDESQLFALGDNFRHHGAPEDTASFFAAARATGRFVTLIGAADLAPYGGGERSKSHFFGPAEQDEEATAVATFREEHRPGQVTIVGFGRGDRTAHEHGANDEATRAAFGRIDAAIGAIGDTLAPADTLVVLGDHGHDAHGHHLPGTPEQTFALYLGRDFQPGALGRLALTEHRALLGLTIGARSPAVLVPAHDVAQTLTTEARQALGPRLAALFASDDANPSRSVRGTRAALFLGLSAAIVLVGLGGGLVARLAPLWIGAALLAGHGYDFVRRHVHDHGYTPARALWLLVPLALGLWLARASFGAGERRERRAPYPYRAAAMVAVVCLVGLFPTAYFYGSVRASVLAVAGGLVVLAVDRAWARAPAESLVAALAALFVGSLYAVHGEAEGSRYVMTSAGFFPVVAAIGPKLALAAGLARLVRSDRFGRARALSLALLAALALQALVYRGAPRELAALETIEAVLMACFWLCDRHPAARPLRPVLLACALVWLLVPTIGLRLSGIDFGFAFRVVPIARYEELWGLVALLLVTKLALPFVLVALLVQAHAAADPSADNESHVVALEAVRLLALRLLLLVVFVAAYRATRPAGSRLVLEMLAEAVLVPFAIGAFGGACGGLSLARRLLGDRRLHAAVSYFHLR